MRNFLGGLIGVLGGLADSVTFYPDAKPEGDHWEEAARRLARSREYKEKVDADYYAERVKAMKKR